MIFEWGEVVKVDYDHVFFVFLFDYYVLLFVCVVFCLFECCVLVDVVFVFVFSLLWCFFDVVVFVFCCLCLCDVVFGVWLYGVK